MNSRKKTISCLIATLILIGLAGCASTKNFNVYVPTKARTTAATIQALKCAAQQSGWNITYVDETCVSAQMTVGGDNVPLTLNLRVQPDNPIKVFMTTHEPRGIKGATLYQRPFIEALKNCGSYNVQWELVPTK